MLDNCNQKSAYEIALLKGYDIMTIDPEFANDNSVIVSISIRCFLHCFSYFKPI